MKKSFLTSFLFGLSALFLVAACGGDKEALASKSEEALSSLTSVSEGIESSIEQSSEPIESPQESIDSEESSQSAIDSEESSENEELPDSMEKDDLATSGIITSCAPINNGVDAVYTIQKEVVSEESSAALKGVFKPTATSGSTVSTLSVLPLQQAFGGPVDLRNRLFVYEIKMENCDAFSSLCIVDSNGNNTAEFSFELDESSMIIEPAILCLPLENGWMGVMIDFVEAFPDETDILQNASEILFFFSNDGCDTRKDSVFYFDNMQLSDPLSEEYPDDPPIGGGEDELLEPFGSDLATSGVISSRAPENYGAENLFFVQEEVVSEDSVAALMGIFSYFGEDAYNETEIWTWSVLGLEDFYGEPCNLQGHTLVYDVLTENCGIYSSFIVVDSNGSRSKELTFAFNRPSLTYPGIAYEKLQNGWTRVFLDFDVAFPEATDILQDASEIFIMFTNRGCVDPEESSVFYMDNMRLFSSVQTEETDIASVNYVTPRAPENYGTECYDMYMQSDVVSQNSQTALAGCFNNIGAPVYVDNAIWTWAEIHLDEYYGTPQDLTKKALVYDVKTENCHDVSSVIVVSDTGERSAEVSFNLKVSSSSEDSISRTILSNGWTRVTIDFFTTYFDDPILRSASSLLIMFSNRNCDASNDSTFYLDNAGLVDSHSSKNVVDVTVYNPDGYYSKSQPLHVKIVGNCFVSSSFSDSANLLQFLCNELGANVTVSYLSIGNGRIPDQYERAFGSDGYMYTEKVDVLFIQAFYAPSDVLELGPFLTELYALSPKTELKIYAGENETEDGVRAASYYGVDHVDWRNAIKTLKTAHSFTNSNLNAYDGWRPNDLSGFVGALMMYMELFGEAPDFEKVKSLVKDSNLWSFLPGIDNAEKEANFGNVYSVAKKFVLGD